MKIEEVKTRIMQAFLKHQKITAQQLNYTPYNIPFVQAYGVLAHLIERGAVTKEEDNKTYTLIDKDKLISAFEMGLTDVTKPEKVSKPTPVLSGRNISQYMFEKVKRSKGRTVLAVVQAYVSDNKDVTYKQLLTVFPPQVKRFGTINLLSEAKELSPDPKRPRYFFKDEDVIKLKNQSIVVTNQWTHSAFLEFVVLVKALGYVIMPE
ncbi:MAG: hypothetical protein HYU68_00490 [Bacteroidetes bacterium]|nr:hypothetical protein [Bacteroidota bacterium]